jgi:hypothetical protein
VRRRRDRQRYARELALFSPRGMVTAATERRLAGDWRGACAAALVDVEINLGAVAATYGAREAERIEADLAGLAPDLLRRFLPRAGGWLLAGATVVLDRSDRPVRRPLPLLGPRVPRLVATLPRSWQLAPQRVTLRVDHRLPDACYDLPDWAWHADAVAARRRAYGCSETRLPWHFPDGTPYPRGTVTPAEQAADRAGEFERIVALVAARRHPEAVAAAGLALEPPPPRSADRRHGREVARSLTRLGTALPVARAEYLRFTARYGRRGFRTPVRLCTVDQGVVRMPARPVPAKGPLLLGVPAPLDVALLRWGDLGPDDLHPLVHEALFPGRTQRMPSPAAHEPVPLLVRCGAGWHPVVATGGRLRTLRHDEAEIDRDLTLAGCAAAVRSWRSGTGPAPRAIRRDRRELFALVQHGDTEGLLARFAAGLDSGLRAPGGGSLLHRLAHVDHRRMLPVLLAAGLSLTDRDHRGFTPLHAAAAVDAQETMAALVGAGADPEARTEHGRTVADLVARHRGR